MAYIEKVHSSIQVNFLRIGYFQCNSAHVRI